MLRYIAIFLFSILILLGVRSRFELFAHDSLNDYNDDSKIIKIMTYNINLPNDKLLSTEFKDSVLKIIKEEDPDILCFQELFGNNYRFFEASLDSLFNFKLNKSNKSILNSSIYTKFKALEFKNYVCRGEIDTIGFTDAEKQEVGYFKIIMPYHSTLLELPTGDTISLFNCHLRSNAYSTARRSINKNNNWFSGFPSYYRNYKIARKIRIFEANNLRYELSQLKIKNIPIIVAGDMNDFSRSDCLNAIKEDDLIDTWIKKGKGFGFTYQGWNLRLRLDHILCNDKLEVIDIKVINSPLSDHRPVVATLRIK